MLIMEYIKYICFISFYIVRGSRPGKNVQLTESEIRGLCLKSREIFLSQPILLELEAPLKICGKLIDENIMGISHLSASTTHLDCNTIINDVQMSGLIENFGKNYNNKTISEFCSCNKVES